MPEAVFAVVQFLDERKVEVVRRSWLQNSEEVLRCFWPPKKKAKDPAIVERGDMPDKVMWPLRPVQIYSFSDSFRKAVNHAKRVQEISSDDDDSDDEDDSQEPVKKRARREVNEESTKENYADDITLPMLGGIKVEAPSSTDTTPNKEMHNWQNEKSSSSQLHNNGSQTARQFLEATILQQSFDFGIQPSTSSVEDKDSQLTGFQSFIIMRLQGIEETLTEILRIQHQMVTSTGGSCDMEEEVFQTPLECPDELGALCEKLEDVSYRKQLISFFTLQGGQSIGDTVRRIMKKLGTNMLWSQYSLKGKKGKLPFLDLSIAKAVISACIRNHENAKAGQIEEEIADFLKYAPQKFGGSRYKAPAAVVIPDGSFYESRRNNST